MSVRVPRRPQRWRRLIALAVVALIGAALGAPAVVGFVMTAGLVYAPCDAAAATPADFGLAWEDVTIPARDGGSFRAYFIPGSVRAAILIAPTTNAGRGNRLALAALLNRHGFAVLAFESRRCAGLGPLSLGYREADDIGDALVYLQTRSDVDPRRIGVTGFSSAGAAAVMAAARYPDLRAVVAEGGYGDFAGGAIGLGTPSANPLEAIFKTSLGFSYRLLTGVDIDRLSPQAVIGSIAPRPILLIYGSQERSLAGAYAQLAAAGPTATLWVIEGGRHGTYLHDAPDAYEARVAAFFAAALRTP